MPELQRFWKINFKNLKTVESIYASTFSLLGIHMGGRISEILKIQSKNVEFTADGCNITLEDTKNHKQLKKTFKNGDYENFENPIYFLKWWDDIKKKQKKKSVNFFIQLRYEKSKLKLYNTAISNPSVEKIGKYIDEILENPVSKKRTFHCFKATSINFLLSKGYDAFTVASFVGNSVDSLKRYVRDELLQKIVSEKDPFKCEKKKRN